ncbi:unnamed protein product, partial [Prorocentrum cordatum]
MQDARALLESLMGNDRNASLQERKVRKFSDDDICKKFLLGLCPHDMFTNTKTDLGPCKGKHNDTLKEMFEEDPKSRRYRKKWRPVLRQHLLQLLQDVDRRFESNQSYIKEKRSGAGADAERAKLKQEISEKVRQAELAADDGRFEESRAIMKDVELTKRRAEDLDAPREKTTFTETVCEVCGLRVSAEEARR